MAVLKFESIQTCLFFFFFLFALVFVALYAGMTCLDLFSYETMKFKAGQLILLN